MASSNLSHCGRVVSRRSFIERTFGVAGAAAVSQLSVARGAHASGKEQIRIALIGAGGRGTGAAFNVLLSKPNVKLVAIADAFRQRLDGSLKRLAAQFPKQVDVPAERRFVDLDGFIPATSSVGTRM